MHAGWERSHPQLGKTKEALNALEWIIYRMPALGSPDGKPDDPDYEALRAQASSTLEAFSQFLSTPAAIELAWEVQEVFLVLGGHGEKAALLSPPLIQAMCGNPNAFKKVFSEDMFGFFAGIHKKWITPPYHNLKPDDSGQVRSLPFLSYESALTLNFTLIHHPNAAIVASASANAVDLDNPPVNSSSVAADTATHRASTTMTSVHTINSARPDPEALPLTSFPAPSTAPIHESDSAEPNQSAPMSEDALAPQADPAPV